MAESAGNSQAINRWITRNAGGESVMAKAFVLIETTVGRTKEVATALKDLKGITSVNAVTGPYDVIAIIEAETLNEIGDIVILKPEWGNKTVIITKFNPTRPKNRYGIRIDSPRATRTYCCSDNMIDRKVGHVNDDHPFLLEATAKEDAKPTNSDLAAIDTYVRNLKVGEVILIKRRDGSIQRWVFCRYLKRGQKYKFAATNPNGKTYRMPLEAVEVLA